MSDVTLESLAERVDNVLLVLASIEEQTKKTNGRVSAIEVAEQVRTAVEAERARTLAHEADVRAQALAVEAVAKAQALVAQGVKTETRRWNVGTLLTAISVTCGLAGLLYGVLH